MTISPLGDSAVVIATGDAVDSMSNGRIQAVAAEISRHPPSGVVDVVPAFGSIALYFDSTHAAPFEATRSELEMLVARSDAAAVSVTVRTLEIPVCYGGEWGPDLDRVAAHTQLTAATVVTLHAGADYVVDAIGFAPGFPYLGGLPPRLEVPRRATPRPSVPAGSVGIGGVRTGIYPLETPGGWNLLGRTPLRLFDAARAEPALLRAGDRVRFRAITADEFHALALAPPPGPELLATAAPSHDNADIASLSSISTGPGRPGAVPGIEILRAGMFTTIQDLGRRGHRAHGVPLGGAADAFALRLVNSLVGNAEDAAALEFTLIGPELKFLHDTLIAVGGGEFGELPRWRPLFIRAGTTVKLGPVRSGCRGYLAAAGGIDVAPVLGSRSTYVRGELGGFQGRPLRDGDVLPVPVVQRHFRDHWRIDERIVPEYSTAPVLRIVPGEQAPQYDEGWEETNFKVSSQSDRMGVRLIGPGLRRRVTTELTSSPVAPGTVQVPPNGQPILLLADAQTIGGYAQVAHVISVDLPLVAQLKAGDTVRFRLVTLGEARELIAAQERALALLREGLAQKLA